ncbi:MAG TPA: Rid family detoxifying hydrolase [candidate division Zixibacteria bacterium]|jgi:2-iminobutanoate/2-iminopropanoate deaminase
MTLRSVFSPEGLKPVGPYSPVLVDDERRLAFASGFVGIDPQTGKMVTGEIAEQTVQTLKNMKATLDEAGSGMDRVVKTTVFLIDLSDFAAMNEAYAKFFPGIKPARSTIQVSRLPLDALVEIEAIAVL